MSQRIPFPGVEAQFEECLFVNFLWLFTLTPGEDII